MSQLTSVFIFLLLCFSSFKALSKSQNSLVFDFSKKPVHRKAKDKLIPLCSRTIKDHKDYLPCIRQLSRLSKVMIQHNAKGEMQFNLYIPVQAPANSLKKSSLSKTPLDPYALISQSQSSFFPLVLDFLTFKPAKADENQQSDGNAEFVNVRKVAFNPNNIGVLEVQEPTLTLPATTLIREVSDHPGCFILDKQEEGLTDTEACISCIEKNPDPDMISPEMFEAFTSLQPVLENLLNFGKQAKGEVFHKTVGSNSGTFIERICQPEQSLEPVIAKFNQSCPKPYKNNFQDFLQNMYCQTCSQGIAPEIMLAIMSLNDQGMCNVRWDRSKRVYLPFSVDPKKHTCQSETGSKKQKIKRCLQDPIDHVNTGLGILTDFYISANNPPPASLPNQCKSWVDMTTEERDKWKRGGSSLHSNDPDLMQKTTQALSQVLSDVRFYKKDDPKDFSKMMERVGIDDLETAISKIVEIAPECYQVKEGDVLSWDRVKFCMFVQKLVSEDVINKILKPGFSRVTRQLSVRNNMENYAQDVIGHIAYVEAIFGSDVRGSSPGIVELWSQYLRNNKPKNCENRLEVKFDNIKTETTLMQN